MKVLVTYFSQTGNTEQIARAIHEEASSCSSPFLKKTDENAPTQLDEYDHVFIGSPCHADTLAEPVRSFLNLIPDNSPCHLAGFVTHASSFYNFYNKSDYENCMTYLSSLCRKKGIPYRGCFECQGRLAPQLREFIKKSKHSTHDEWARMVAQMEGHPDSEDLTNARDYARDILMKFQLD